MGDHADRDFTDLYFDERMETLPSELLRKLQDHRLRWQFRRCWDGSEWYRARFEAAGLSPETFGGLADLVRLPLLTADDLHMVGGVAWRVAPTERIAFRHETPLLTRHLTDGDVTHEQDRSARARWAAGLQRPDQLSDAPIGATLLRAGHSRRMGPIAADPAERIPMRPLSVDHVGTVVGYECRERIGFHWAADQLLTEVIAPMTGQPLSELAPGELVVTDLVREASPLVRYRTGLEVTVTQEDCACGRTPDRALSARPLT